MMKSLFQKPKKSGKNDAVGRIVSIPVERICSSQKATRRRFDPGALCALADSIKLHGMLQPIAVRRIRSLDLSDVPQQDVEILAQNTGESVYQPGKPHNLIPNYEIVSGERRFRAAKLLGMRQVPCLLIDCTERQASEFALIEALQREQLHYFEEAEAIATLMRVYALSSEQVANRLSIGPSYISGKLRLLQLDAEERDLILTHRLSERHAKAVSRLDAAELRQTVLKQIISDNLSASQTEELVKGLRFGKENEKTSPKSTNFTIKDPRLCYNTLENALDRICATGVPMIRQRREDNDTVEYLIRFPKTKEEPTATILQPPVLNLPKSV